MSDPAPLARILLGMAVAILAGLGGSLLLARARAHGLMRWPAAVATAAAIALAVAAGVRAWG